MENKTIELNINMELIQIFLRKGMSINEIGTCLMILELIYKKEYDFLVNICMLDENLILTLRNMYLNDLLNIQNAEEEKIYILSEFSQNVLDSFFKKEYKKNPKKNNNHYNYKDWIKDWVNLWKDEKGVFYKAPYDKGIDRKRTLGSSVRDAEIKMEKFLRDYDEMFKEFLENFPNVSVKDIIFAATKTYIDEYKKMNFLYCRKCIFFISKTDTYNKNAALSDLSTYCMMIMDNLKDNGGIIHEQEEVKSQLNTKFLN